MSPRHKLARRIPLLLGLWPVFVFAETTPDLAPLLPSPAIGTAAVRAAVEAGDIPRATELANGLARADERRLWLGTLAIIGNEPVRAIRILRAGPGNPKALGVAYYLARQYLLFRDQMAEAMRQQPEDFGPYYFLGRHYDSDLDDFEEAVRWLRRALEKEPGYARARAHLGHCLERLGKVAEAETAYRASAGMALSQAGMARLKLAAGETKEALEWVEKAIATEPRDVAGQRLAARIYETLGRPAGAIAALEQAVKAAPTDASLHYLLHRLHRSSGNYTRARAELEEFERLRAIYGAQP